MVCADKRRRRKSHVASHTEAMKRLLFLFPFHSSCHHSVLIRGLVSTLLCLSVYDLSTVWNQYYQLTPWREVICDYHSHFHVPISYCGAVGKEEEEGDRRWGVFIAADSPQFFFFVHCLFQDGFHPRLHPPSTHLYLSICLPSY